MAAFGHAGPGEPEARAGGRRVPLAATFETTSRLVYPGDAVYDAACDGSRMVEVSGVGTSSEFGLLKDRQAHCLGAPDFSNDVVRIPVTQGAFRLTDLLGRTVTGEYRGTLVQTFNGGFNELGPTGQWIIEGEACVSGGTRFDSIVDDCAVGRWAPVRGLQNLTSQQTTVFLDQTVGVKR
jgi:hypothetical protein